MKRVERGEAEAIGALEIMKELSHKLWRPLSRMSLVPVARNHQEVCADQLQMAVRHRFIDRKSTRLNSSHTVISYAVFCLKKKKKRSIHKHIHNQTKPHI